MSSLAILHASDFEIPSFYHAENRDKRNASENATAFDVGYYYMYTFITSMYLRSWNKTTISDVHCSLISDIFLKLKTRML